LVEGNSALSCPGSTNGV